MNENLPQAYKLGYQDFYGNDFLVTKDVLIPRPETEQLIDAVLNLAGVPYLSGVTPSENKLGSKPKILDVGTGSGCIAITLKLKLKNATIIATDLSKKALAVARKNAENLNADVTFKEADLLSNLDFLPDLIVANLPYVNEKWDWLDKNTLDFEPKEALYATDNGLFLIKKLIDQATARKIKYLILEADPCEHQEIIKYTKDYELLETRGFILVFRKKA